MKTIKNIIYALGAIFVTVIGIFLVSKNKNKKLEKLDTQIKNNNKKIEVVKNETDLVRKEKIEVNEKVADTKEKVNNLKTEKKTITPTVRQTTSQAKQNIISKTKKK
jgi:archaellum component FlaC